MDYFVTKSPVAAPRISKLNSFSTKVDHSNECFDLIEMKNSDFGYGENLPKFLDFLDEKKS